MSKLTTEQREELIDQALAAREFAYNPYSKFRVGAALRTVDGKIFTGCNVENASYGGAICAERTAFVKAVSEGHRKFTAIGITCDHPILISPCGICRQFMNEFGGSLEVYSINPDRTYRLLLLSDFLPHAFGPEDLPDNGN